MKCILVIFVTFIAMASATPIESEEKTLVNVDSGNFLALNSTILVLTVAGVVVLAIALLVLSGSFSPAKIAQRYGQNYQDFYDRYSEDYSDTRYRRSANNGNVIFRLYN